MPRRINLTVRCKICGETDHTNPSCMSTYDLLQHRITEWRDCRYYNECLGEAAIIDAVMVPCLYCRNYPKLGGI